MGRLIKCNGGIRIMATRRWQCFINKFLNKIEMEKSKINEEYINDLNNYKILT